MRNVSYSFQPDGYYFVFDVDTGETIKRDIPTLAKAKQEWIIARGMDN